MKLHFTGDLRNICAGLEILGKRLGLQFGAEGKEVTVTKRQGDLEVKAGKSGISIQYQESAHFYRALGHLAERIGNGCEEFHITETQRFKTNGIMADCSRNAVLSVESVKDIIELMAVMGLNMLMLYTEDTYEIEPYPYFGYMRGRYTFEELKECDDYADLFGISIIPCIQTLAHLSAALKWDYADGMRDTDDILLAGEPDVYDFIEEMIKAASAPFRSKRIHIGMDEAHFIGLGKYLSKNGYKNRFGIMNGHLEKVCAIARKYALEPMIWSDMYFRLASKAGDYYDNAEIPQNVRDSIPKGAQMVYWDYYHTAEEGYKRLIKRHRELGPAMLFAGGIWTWNGISVNYDMTFAATNAALKACKDEGVDEVFATMWGDNGAETNIFAALPGMQLFAEHGYSQAVDNETLKTRFKACTGQNMNDFLKLNDFDRLGQEINTAASNPSKWLLWQDILIGLFDRHVENIDLQGHYTSLAVYMKDAAASSGRYGFIFEAAQKLAQALSIKAGIGVRLKTAYDANDKAELARISNDILPMLRGFMEELRLAYMRQWFATNKPFGWEVLDMRFGGILTRIDTAICRINQFLTGEINGIPELTEKRLYFNGEDKGKRAVPRVNNYSRIASASVMM
ncbi:MAG: beta-N-acetylhexosaminidase [Defluviitaleaceae bacterium]|nr:beta-N-acetylhexosaminidase [Defluviitaleaceae bacterium]MCL2835328.1 beta-N-acetylhexosaminidase [Defluviitaleaceae bacterium]